MIRLLLLLCLTSAAAAQGVRVTPVVRMYFGTPSAGDCATQAQVNLVQLALDVSTTASAGVTKFYACANDGGTIGWKPAGTGTVGRAENTFSSGATSVTVTHTLGTIVAVKCYLGTAPNYDPFEVPVQLNATSTVFTFVAAPSAGKCVVIGAN